MRSFVMSALRRAKWPQKYKSIGKMFLKDGTNPATGHKCKLHKCSNCGAIGPKGALQADHREPVVPINGKWGRKTKWLGYNWNELLPRLFIDEAGFDPICKPCHKTKTQQEREQRKAK